MCGITGFVDFNKKSAQTTLEKMTLSLHHRGPDGHDEKLIETPNYTLGLGHKRLSILDLSNHASQPMEFNNHWICFNGEVYNFKEIREDLKNLGHSFKTDSDTEVILHAYIEWKEKALERFIGMFAIVIYNHTDKKLFAARDRVGVKPFYYYIKNGLFLFASELKAFHQNESFEKEIDLNAVGAFMQYGNVPTPNCIFKNTLKLKPGHFIEIDLTKELGGIQKVKQQQYWNVYDYYNAPKSQLSYSEAKSKTKGILTSAFDYRMIADVPVGVFLSGGFDSTCVASILQAELGHKLKTFTIGVPDIGLNEAPYAKDIAQHLKTDHTEITCTEKEAVDFVGELPYYFDEPFADSSAIPTSLVSKIARKDVTVALSADGGDEIFAGYNRYDYIMRYGQKLNKIPKFSRNIIVGGMNRISSESIPVLKNKYNFHNRYEKLKMLLKDPSDQNIMLSLSQQYTDEQIKSLFDVRVHPLETAYTSSELINGSPLSYMQAIDFQTYLVDDILQKVDRSTMIHSLEGREPFLDHRIIEFAATLPDEYKYHQGEKKRIIRDITYDYIPKDLLNRPKMGFAIPIADWLQNDLRDLIETYFDSNRIQSQGIFSDSAIQQLKTDFLRGKKELDMKVWYFISFQMWFDKWM